MSSILTVTISPGMARTVQDFINCPSQLVKMKTKVADWHHRDRTGWRRGTSWAQLFLPRVKTGWGEGQQTGELAHARVPDFHKNIWCVVQEEEKKKAQVVSKLAFYNFAVLWSEESRELNLQLKNLQLKVFVKKVASIIHYLKMTSDSDKKYAFKSSTKLYSTQMWPFLRHLKILSPIFLFF